MKTKNCIEMEDLNYAVQQRSLFKLEMFDTDKKVDLE